MLDPLSEGNFVTGWKAAMKDPDIKVMTRTDLEDEVMLLRAQVKVLQNWRALHERLHRNEMVSAQHRAFLEMDL